MSNSPSEQIPLMQRVYNRIWILAVLALLFFFLVYVGWGVLDVLSVPAR